MITLAMLLGLAFAKVCCHTHTHTHQAVDSFFLSFLLVFVLPFFSPFHFHSLNLPSLISFHLVLRSLPSPLFVSHLFLSKFPSVETIPAAFNLFPAIFEQTWLTYEHIHHEIQGLKLYSYSKNLLLSLSVNFCGE